MELIPRLAPLGISDAFALGILIIAFFSIGWLVENPPKDRPSMSILLASYRRDWMREFVTRQQKIFDATVITSLRQATSFFISGTMLSIGGCIALVGNPDRLVLVAEDLTVSAQAVVVEVKVILVILFLANAFLKFIWSHRLFGYCAVLMGSVPNDDSPLAFHRASQAADVNVTAARSYNRGLRSIYFALASLGWLLGPWTLIIATIVTSITLLRREFMSHSRVAVLDREGV
ncbi:DUF599 domain-containing protein [Falsirhodobacter sp. alg1]|uniref:DUF599 domain-containing protein n=1 Tax=Falsirhodobacter sp. alg1 TaxID=1472418 RepID=UPI0005EE7681|nr:DUF599 domain-containing protein [Falsirhodobacter sp. alg1]